MVNVVKSSSVEISDGPAVGPVTFGPAVLGAGVSPGLQEAGALGIFVAWDVPTDAGRITPPTRSKAVAAIMATARMRLIEPLTFASLTVAV